MERLTKRINDVVTYIGTENEYDTGMIAAETASSVAAVREILLRLAAYEDTGLTPEEITCIQKCANEDKALTKCPECLDARLRELAEADKDGRCVVLPCKQGDTVWFKTYKNSARDCIGIQPHEVTRISVEIIVPGEFVDIGIPVSQIGRRIFLSESEAVAAETEPLSGSPIVKF